MSEDEIKALTVGGNFLRRVIAPALSTHAVMLGLRKALADAGLEIVKRKKLDHADGGKPAGVEKVNRT